MFSHFFGQKRLIHFLFLANFIGVAFATLWPFDFSPPNGVAWIPNQSGIHFSHPGVLISSSPLMVPPSAKDSVTIEVWLRSDENWSLRNVLGIFTPGNLESLHIFQWDGGLLVSRNYPRDLRARTAGQIYLTNVFRRGRSMFLTIVSSVSGTTVYVNGEQKQFFPNFQISPKDISGRLILGTAPTDFSPWRGDLYLLTFYSSALSPEDIRRHYDSLSGSNPALSSSSSFLLAQYLFSESSGSVVHSSIASAPNLQIPSRFSVPYKPILQSLRTNYRSNWSYYQDALINIFGFVPYGFLLHACLVGTRFSRFAVLCSFLSGAVFSFLIELTQGYIPQRDSGFNDVITNGLGALFGALLAAHLARRSSRN